MKVLQTISIILGLAIAFLAGYDEITENTSELISSIGNPTMSLLKIIGIILILYWITYFLLKLIKKHNNKILQQPLPIYKTPLNHELPPKDYLDEILLLISKSKSNYLHINDICDNFTEDKNIILHYTDLLITANFLQRYNKLPAYSILDPEQQPLELSPDGREYLVKNKLINQGGI